MSAITTARGLTTQYAGSPVPNGYEFPVADNVVCLSGTIAVSDGSGYVKMGVTGTGLVCVGRFYGPDVDNTVTGHTAGGVLAAVQQGVFNWNNSTGGDTITIASRGALCYIVDNQTVALTDGGGTRSIAGVIIDVTVNGSDPQVWVQMGVYVGQAVNVSGALLVASVQTNTGAKTFADNTLLVNNSGGSFATTLHSLATAARSFSLPDIANATALADAGAQTITGIKTFASGADPLFAREADHALIVTASATATTAGGALAIAAGAGKTSGAGGAASLTGGASDTTGTGGAASLVGGAGGSVSGAGGAVSVAGGAGSAGNANGGAVSIDGGAKNGSGTDGAINIGANHGAYANFGVPIRAAATAFSIADPGNAGAIPVTNSGVCNLTSAGAETRTAAIPTFVGQTLTLCQNVYGGAVAVTFASAINVAGNTIWTTSAVDQNIHLIACLKAGTRCWRVINKDGGALS